MSPLRVRRGLTLVELLVAITLLGIASSAGYGAFAMLVDRRDALLVESEHQRHAAATRALLAEWIAHAQLDPLRPGTTFQGVDGTAENDPADELTFLTSAPTPLETPRALVTLRIDRASGGPPRLVAVVREWNGTRSMTLGLVDEVQGFDVHYVQLGESRLSSWISGSVLPRGVILRLNFAASSERGSLLALPLHVVIGSAR
jgi:prepilin-type N-terminal cleavage/methylation domain-containing protein